MDRICVFAGSNPGTSATYRAAADELGRTLARRRIGLVYGGARVGLMGALADAALASGGEVIGVIPEALVAREIAHAGLSELRLVGSMHERKALMNELADGFIALPGGWGTLEEWFEVLTWGQLGLHRKPCGLLNAAGYFDGLLRFIDHMIQQGFVRPEFRSAIVQTAAPEALLDSFEAYQAPHIPKWIDLAAT